MINSAKRIPSMHICNQRDDSVEIVLSKKLIKPAGNVVVPSKQLAFVSLTATSMPTYEK